MTKKYVKGKIVLGDNMKSKDKTKKYIKITLKNIIYLFAFIIILFYLATFYNLYFVKSNVFAKQVTSNVDNIEISNAKKMEIDDILDEDDLENSREEYFVEEVELEYITKYRDNSSLPKNKIQVIQEGREGKQEITKKIIYENEEKIAEEQVSAKVTKGAVDKIVEVGTANYTSNYKIKVGDIVYATSDRLSIMVEPNENSQKISTLGKGTELKILEILDDWYKIASTSGTGYVKIESTASNNNIQTQMQDENKIIKTQSNLSFDMVLNKPSGLSLEQFKKVLTDSKDINKIFIENAQYFYYIEKQYNINGIFVASIAIHESAWGTSQLAKNKNNLFGYGAYDSNPYNGAYEFSSYSESIDLLARVLVKYYLNPKGTKIYDGQVALGTYYNGSTLSGVNTNYASDKGWASKVYVFMKALYSKL